MRSSRASGTRGSEQVTPGWLCAVEGQGSCLMDATCNSACHHRRRELAEFEKVDHAVHRPGAGRCCKDCVAVEWQMGRQQGTSQSVLCHDRQPVCLRLGDDGIRDDDADGGCCDIDPFNRVVRSAVEMAGGMPRPPNSLFSSNGAAQKCGPSPMVGVPSALTATSAAIRCPLLVTALAEPRPPLTVAVVAPVPAPTLPSGNSPLAAARNA